MNAFSNYGEAATVAPVRRKEAIATRRLVKTEARRAMAALDESAALMKRYRHWMKERREKLLDGPFGKDAKGLESFLRTMTPSSAPALLKFIERSSWLQADKDTRFEVLDMISRAITRVRLNAGLTPFDDPMPDEPNNAFLTIREYLAC